MENYVGHIKELAEKRADHLESERIALKSQADCLAKLLSPLDMKGSLEEKV